MSEGWKESNPVNPEVSFNSGTEKRLPVILMLDTSQSMGKASRHIDELNTALDAWASEVRSTPSLTKRVEIAIITFGMDGVQQHSIEGHEFCPAYAFKPPTPLTADYGVTPMITAIRKAIDLADKRKRQLDASRNPTIGRLRPMIFMITDGEPTDDDGNTLPHSALVPIATEIAQLEAGKKLGFFAAGVSGADFDALRTLVPDGWWDVTKGRFAEFLKEASTSLGAADPIQAMRDLIVQTRQA